MPSAEKFKPRIVSFDCYGTLIDWETGARNAFRRLITSENLSIGVDELYRAWEVAEFKLIQGPYAKYREILIKSLSTALQSFGITLPNSRLEFFGDDIKAWVPFPEVKEALEGIRRHAALAIISNTDNEIIGASLQRIGVKFDHVITAEDAAAYKPSRQIFDFALGRFGCRASEVLHVSFSYRYDLSVASNLGFKTCLLNRGGKNLREEALKLGVEVTFQISSLHELKELIAP